MKRMRWRSLIEVWLYVQRYFWWLGNIHTFRLKSWIFLLFQHVPIPVVSLKRGGWVEVLILLRSVGDNIGNSQIKMIHFDDVPACTTKQCFGVGRGDRESKPTERDMWTRNRQETSRMMSRKAGPDYLVFLLNGRGDVPPIHDVFQMYRQMPGPRVFGKPDKGNRWEVRPVSGNRRLRNRRVPRCVSILDRYARGVIHSGEPGRLPRWLRRALPSYYGGN